MPRVCARCAPVVVVLVGLASARVAHASERARHLGLYVARVGTATAPASAAELPAVSSTIAATARGPLVEVVTTQTFSNPTEHAIEAVYVFPVPADAAVTAMAIKVGTTTIHAEVVARDDAVARHEAAVAAGVTGALLEADRPDVLTQTITGIAPGATVEVEVRWDTIASRRDAAWELVVPLVVAPRAVPGTATGRGVVGSGTSPDTDRSPDASRVTPPTRDDGGGIATTFRLVLDGPATEVTSPSHELAVATSRDGTTITGSDARSARDLVVRWRTKPRPRGRIETAETAADDGFAAVTIEAGAPHGKARAVRAVIAIDDDGAAGSEAAVIGHRVERALIAALGRRDRVAVRGRDGAFAWRRGKVELDGGAGAASRHDLVRMLAAVGRAVEAADGAGTEVVLVTDGLVADQAAVVEAARGVGVPVNVVGVGAAPNRSLVGAIATATGGTARFVDGDGATAAASDDPATDPAAAVAAAVLGDLRHPTATPTIDWGGLEVSDAVPATLPRLGAGQAVTVLGRVAAPRVARAKVTGGGGGAFGFEIDARPAAPAGATTPDGLIARLWARARLAELVAGQAAPADVQRLALAHGLVSPYTAMIAVGEQVVDRDGTRRSLAIPVAVPRGMRWQARFRDDQSRERDVAKNPAAGRKDDSGGDTAASVRDGAAASGATPQPVAPVPPVVSAPVAVPPSDPTGVQQDESTFSLGAGDAGEVDARAEADGDRGAYKAPVNDAEMVASSGSGVGGGRRLVLALRGTGGVAFAGGERAGLGAVSGVAGFGAGRFVLGADLSLWIVGSSPDLVFRPLLSATIAGLGRGWVDLSLGAGAHIADRAGLAYGLGLRFGSPRLGRVHPVLRYDGAVVPGDDDKVHTTSALDLGLQVEW